MYWVYHDPPAGRATLHTAACSFCNDGRGRLGTRRIRKSGDSRIGPLRDLDIALAAIRSLEHRSAIRQL